jgi:hypothetical protein
MNTEHLQNDVKVGEVESFQPVDHTLEPLLYEKRQLTFTVGNNTYTVNAWVPSSTIKTEHRGLIPVNKYLIDVSMHSSNPDMHFEFQLDLRNLSLTTKSYHGPVPFDANDQKPPYGTRQEILSGLGNFALTHLYPLLANVTDRTTYQQPEHPQT